MSSAGFVVPKVATKLTLGVNWRSRGRAVLEGESVWEPAKGRDVRLDTSLPAGEDAECIAFLFKANGELITTVSAVNHSVLGSFLFERVPEEEASDDRARIKITWRAIPADVAAIFFSVGARRIRTPGQLEIVSARLADTHAHEMEDRTVFMAADDLESASTVILAALIQGPSSANTQEPSWIYDELSLGLSGVTLVESIPNMQRLLKERHHQRFLDNPLLAPVANERVRDNIFLSLLGVSLKWDLTEGEPDADLDLACVVVDYRGAIVQVVTYGNATDNSGAIVHSGDARRGYDSTSKTGGVETISIDTTMLPQETAALYILVNAFTAISHRERPAPRGYLRLLRGYDGPGAHEADRRCVLSYAFAQMEMRESGVVAFSLTRHAADRNFIHWTVAEHLWATTTPTCEGSLAMVREHFLNGAESKPTLTGWRKDADPAALLDTITLDRHVTEPVPPMPQRTLSMKLIRAWGLLAADAGGTSDPFAIIALTSGHKAQSHRTAVVWKELNPQWNESYDFEGPFSEEGTEVVDIQLWDKDMIFSDPLGSVRVPIKETNTRGPVVLNLGGSGPKGASPTGFLLVAFAWDDRAKLTAK